MCADVGHPFVGTSSVKNVTSVKTDEIVHGFHNEIIHELELHENWGLSFDFNPAIVPHMDWYTFLHMTDDPGKTYFFSLQRNILIKLCFKW